MIFGRSLLSNAWNLKDIDKNENVIGIDDDYEDFLCGNVRNMTLEALQIPDNSRQCFYPGIYRSLTNNLRVWCSMKDEYFYLKILRHYR